jgi:hypothetical protein
MILHEFYMADVEDPYLYAGFPISEWQATEMGQWVMANVAEEPVFHITPDPNTLGYRVVITGQLNPEAATYFTLKFK